MPCGSSSEYELSEGLGMDGEKEQISQIFVPAIAEQRVTLTYGLPSVESNEAVEVMQQTLDASPTLRQQLGEGAVTLSFNATEGELEVMTSIEGAHVDAEAIIPHVTQELAAFGVETRFGHPLRALIYEVPKGEI